MEVSGGGLTESIISALPGGTKKNDKKSVRFTVTGPRFERKIFRMRSRNANHSVATFGTVDDRSICQVLLALGSF
jgi:hypothetical protein